MKVKIGFLTYKVVVMSKEVAAAKRVYGHINHSKQIISIEDGLTSERYKEVLLHEIVHGVFMAWDIHNGEEEDVVTKVSNGLATVFKDNPKLAKVLF